jgi:ankyrin repeat protein
MNCFNYNIKYIQKKLVSILEEDNLTKHNKAFNLTPLHLAIISGDVKLVKKYCNSSIVNLHTKITKQSPLQLAIEFLDNDKDKRLEIVKILIEAGSNIEEVDKYGEKILDKAMKLEENKDIYHYLNKISLLK